MLGPFAKLSALLRFGPTSRRACARSEAAGLRLDTARHGFELSIVALRKAALDHVDSQDHASLVLRANLARLTARTEAAR